MGKTVFEFMQAMTQMYGDYKRNPGMAAAIEREIDGHSPEKLESLWKQVKLHHAKNFPPTLYELAAIADSARISIAKKEFSSFYVCGNCLTEYTLDQGACPNPRCKTKGFALPETCPFCMLKDKTVHYDDSNGIKTKCHECGGIRTYAFIKRK